MIFPVLKENILLSISYDKKTNVIKIVSDYDSISESHRSFVLFEFRGITKIRLTKGISNRLFNILDYTSHSHSFVVVFQDFNIVSFEEVYFVEIDLGLSYGKVDFYVESLDFKKRVLYAKKIKNDFQYFDSDTHLKVDFYHPFENF